MIDKSMLERFRNEVLHRTTHLRILTFVAFMTPSARPTTKFSLSHGVRGRRILSSLLRRIGRLPCDKALVIARKICAGLAAAHDKGVLHRDLKPSNIK